ncbi:hypothetical protein UlMin_025677 [Ulmus minor]
MRSIEEKGCYNHGPVQEFNSSSSGLSFEFHKRNGVKSNPRTPHHHRTSLGKPTPSKWDDAQKWLVGLSRGGGGEKSHSKTKPRNSNADDLRLIAPVPQKEQEYSSDEDEEGEEVEENGKFGTVVRSICVRDMGTDITPIASQEPSRTTTPLRATTPDQQTCVLSSNGRCETNSSSRANGSTRRYVEESNDCKNNSENQSSDQASQLNPLETRAVAWTRLSGAKYMARYKREEVKIQAWENHEKRKAEMEMKKMERMKARAQERLANKIAATRRIAEEMREHLDI